MRGGGWKENALMDISDWEILKGNYFTVDSLAVIFISSYSYYDTKVVITERRKEDGEIRD